MNKFENINKFFEKVKSIGLVERLFSWGTFSTLSYEAYEDFKFMSAEVNNLREGAKQIDYLKENISKMDKELSIHKNNIEQNNKVLQIKESELGKLEESNAKNQERILELHKEISSYKVDIEQNNKNLQNKESEIGHLEESKSKNNERISELLKEISVFKGTIEFNNKILTDKEIEIGRLEESKEKNEKRILELSKEIDLSKNIIEVNNKELQNKENEIGKLRESDEKNKQRINEFDKELSISKNIIEQDNKELQSKEKEIGKLKEADDLNKKRILELEKEIIYNKNSIEQNNQELLIKGKELGRIKESDEKNFQRINELEREIVSYRNIIEQNNKELQSKEKEIGKLKESDDLNKKRIIDFDKEKELNLFKLDELRLLNTKLQNEISAFNESDKQKIEHYEYKVAELNQLKKQLDDDRIRLQNEREEEIKNKFELIKMTWKNHEDTVQNVITEICNRNSIEYLEKEKIPFKGKPDNTIKIAGEYIIFDAKSPQGEDLTNFPKYIKSQTEYIKKYINEDYVKKDIFLVVPSNTMDVIKNYHHNMVDYRVYVVSVDSLEAIILNLLKIEAYEFAEQLSPEDRENICRVIGKFAHAAKRKIQIDSYLNKQFFDILTDCTILPEDMLTKVIEFEKSDKLNPPLEKRSKEISIKDIKRDIQAMETAASLKNIKLGDVLQAIDNIPVDNKVTI